MKTQILLCLAIISLSFGKNLRFLSVGEVVEDASKMYSLISAASNTGATAMMGHVGMVVDGIATIVTTFKNSYSDKLIDKKQGVGLKSLVGNVEFDFNVGYREKGFDFWVEELKQQFQIPEEFKDDFYGTLSIGRYAEEDNLYDDSFVFNKTDPNDPKRNIVSYLNFMINHYTDKNKKKFNAIITTAEANIKLFPTELIYLETKSIAGGIKETQKQHSKWEDRDLTTKDVENIVKFLQANAYKPLAEIFGISYDTRY